MTIEVYTSLLLSINKLKASNTFTPHILRWGVQGSGVHGQWAFWATAGPATHMGITAVFRWQCSFRCQYWQNSSSRLGLICPQCSGAFTQTLQGYRAKANRAKSRGGAQIPRGHSSSSDHAQPALLAINLIRIDNPG